jgi:hypothetical protein
VVPTIPASVVCEIVGSAVGGIALREDHLSSRNPEDRPWTASYAEKYSEIEPLPPSELLCSIIG